MTTTIALIVTTCLFLFMLDRQARAHDRERGLLLQRIQAPSVAVAQHLPDDPDRPLYLSEEQQDALALAMIEGDPNGTDHHT